MNKAVQHVVQFKQMAYAPMMGSEGKVVCAIHRIATRLGRGALAMDQTSACASGRHLK